MASQHGERKLAAILAADVVGYSRLSGTDEEGTIRRLQVLRTELIDPAVETYRGRIVKTMGDGFLVEFASVVDAVRAFLQVQRGMPARNIGLPPEQRIEFRVGVHIGDVLVQPDGDLLGEGVNLAARLEGIAEPGGICLSEDAYRQVRDRLSEQFVDLGDKEFKNVARPMRVYAVTIDPASPAAAPAAGDVERSRSPGRRQASRRVRGQSPQGGATNLPAPMRVRAPGRRGRLETVEEAITFIDRNVPPELSSLPRWTFARALLLESLKTGKSRDLNAAVRQLTQALRNERWLDETEQARGPEKAK